MDAMRLFKVIVLIFSLLNLQYISNSSTYASESKALESEQFLTLIVMFAIAGTVAVLGVSCMGIDLPSDILVAVAGAVIYIGSEIQALASYEEVDEKIAEIDRTINLEETNKQVQALKLQLSAYENNKNIAEKKSFLQKTAAVAFTTAAGIAFWKHKQLSDLIVSCGAGLVKGQEGLVVAAAAAKPPPSSDIVVLEKAKLTSAQAALQKLTVLLKKLVSSVDTKFLQIDAVDGDAQGSIETTAEAINLSASFSWVPTNEPSLMPIMEMANKACLPLKTLVFKEVVSCSPPELSAQVLWDEKYKNNFWHLLLPSLQANMDKTTSYFGLGAVAAAAFIMIKKDMNELTDQLIASPLGRGVIFSAIALLGYLASSYSNDVVLESEKIILKIKDILAQHEKESSSVYSSGNDENLEDEQRSEDSQNLSSSYKNDPDEKVQMSDIKKNTQIIQPITCDSTTTSSCESLEASIEKQLLEGNVLPTTLVSSGIQAGKEADTIQGTSLDAEVDDQSLLANDQQAVSNELDHVRSQLNSKDNNSGDLKNLSNNLAKDWKDIAAARLTKDPRGASALMSSMGGQGALGSGSSAVREDLSSNSSPGDIESEDQGLSKAVEKSSQSLGGLDNFRFKRDSPKNRKMKRVVKALLKRAQKKKNQRKSIWKIVTEIYILRAYPQLLDKVKKP